VHQRSILATARADGFRSLAVGEPIEFKLATMIDDGKLEAVRDIDDTYEDMLTPTGYPPPHTAAAMAHSTHSTQLALRPHESGELTMPVVL